MEHNNRSRTFALASGNADDFPVQEDTDTDDDKAPKRSQIGGAAVVGGLAGLVLMGPLVGLVAAGGAAVVATTKTKAGDVARSTGDLTVSATKNIKDLNIDQ